MRIIYLDQTRAAAILLVVFIHVWDSFIPQTEFVTSLTGWGVYQLLHLLGRFGVPLFVMITGALMLDRTYPDIGSFIVAKIPRFIAVIVAMAFIYAGLELYLYNTPLPSVFGEILVGRLAGAYQLWYMYMLIGLYISLPFLARMLTLLVPRDIYCLIGFALLLVMLPYTIESSGLEHDYQSNNFIVLISNKFIIQTYALYAITGYWLHKYHGLGKLDIKLRGFLLLLIICITVLVKILLDYQPSTPMPVDGILWYDSLFIYVPSVILFSIVRDWSSNRSSTWPIVSMISTAAFSIYLWHLFVVHIGVYVQYHYNINLFLMVIMTLPVSIVFGILVYKILYRSKLSWLVR